MIRMAYKIKEFKGKKVIWSSPNTFRTKAKAKKVFEELEGNLKSEKKQFPIWKKRRKGVTERIVKV